MAEEDGINGADILVLVRAAEAIIGTGTEANPETPAVYEAVAGQRGATRDRNAATIDTSAKDSGDHERFIPGRKSSTLSMDSLWFPTDTAYQALEAAYDSAALVVLRMVNDGTPFSEADALVTGLSESFPDQDVATCSGNFQVSGGWRDVA